MTKLDLIDGVVLVENKAVPALAPIHEVQLVKYLTTTGIEIGLLLNLGADRLEYKRRTRTYRSKRPAKAFLVKTLFILSELMPQAHESHRF